jgi:chromosome segregation ATPase
MDLKKALDELGETKKELERVKAEAAKNSDAQALLVTIKRNEQEYSTRLKELSDRLRALEEELQTKIVDGEEMHQHNILLAQDSHMLAQKVASLEAALRDKEARNADLAAKVKDLSANLTIEQETSSKLKSERDSLEKEIKGLKEDIAILRQSSSQNSDAVS